MSNKNQIKILDLYFYLIMISQLFQYVLLATAKYGIDESHGLGHSMNVLQYARRIYESELPTNPALLGHEQIIYTSAILHDMCDKKYMNQDVGLYEIEELLVNNRMNANDIGVAKQIMATMSYSTVKKHGFPNLGEYQHAYHIVRESDLLSAYDFDRSMIYHMNRNQCTIHEAFTNAADLFEKRVFKHYSDGLLLTDFAIKESYLLENIASHRIRMWKKILY